MQKFRVSAHSGMNFKSALRNLQSAIVMCALLFALCSSVEAQQPAKAPRIGYLSGSGDPSNPGPLVEFLRQGLQDRGHQA